MKLAEALHLRADLQTRMSQLSQRMINNAKVQEGDEPAEKPEELLAELKKCSLEYETLIARINLTNSRTGTEEEGTLTEMLAKKDAMTLFLRQMRDFLNAASSKVDRYSNKEILVKSTVDVKELQKQVDSTSRILRELDVKIQRLNWTVDLIES